MWWAAATGRRSTTRWVAASGWETTGRPNAGETGRDSPVSGGVWGSSTARVAVPSTIDGMPVGVTKDGRGESTRMVGHTSGCRSWSGARRSPEVEAGEPCDWEWNRVINDLIAREFGGSPRQPWCGPHVF